MTQSLAFPGPEPGDPEDVAWTLQTAGTMWSRGDAHEAVRWLRRAAEAAGDAGNDMRAVSLARAAADLTVALELPPSALPPPVEPVTAPDATHRVPRPPPVRPLDDPDRTDTEYTIPNAMRFEAPRSPPPPPARPRSAAPPPPPRSRPTGRPPALPPPPGSGPPSSSPSRSAPAPLGPPPSSAAPPPSRSSPSAAPPPSRPAPSVRPPPASQPAPSTRVSSPPTRSSPAAHASMGLPNYRVRQTLRVAVVPSPDDRNVLQARLLGDDEPVPEGAHEALLTALEPGAHLTSKRR